MKYIKKYNKYNLQTKCRICLTQSVGTMINVESPLKGISEPKPLVYEALELVMSERVFIRQKYPNTMCAMCVEFLKIAYDLKVQYKQSQEQIKSWLNDLGELSDDEDQAELEVKEKSDIPVEIVVGSQTFDINDLLIVEEDNEEIKNFDGFLQNLGNSVTASFVKKGYKKPKLNVDSPSLVIEKVVELKNEENDIQNKDEEIYLEQKSNELVDDTDVIVFANAPVDGKIVNKFIVVTENDRQALESALNMKYKCPFCSKPMSSLTRVKMHSQACRKKKKSKCYVCGEQYETRKELVSHMKSVHMMEINKIKANKSGKHQCYICKQEFASYGSLAYHMSKHKGRKFSCSICDKWFYTKNQVDIHKQIHNRDKTIVVCPICGKGFHYQSGLFYHMKMHTNERNYQCSYCPRRFYTRNSIKRHELTHTGARPYDCKYCDKKFRSLGEVKKHQFLHTGERPYQCKYCNMAFIQMHNLKVHLMTHSGNFHCTYCSKGFAEKEILIFHLQNKHQIKKAVEFQEYTVDMENEEANETEEQVESVQDQDKIVKEQVLGEEYYIMEEELVDTEEQVGVSNMVVKTYEVQDEVLVETIDDP